VSLRARFDYLHVVSGAGERSNRFRFHRVQHGFEACKKDCVGKIEPLRILPLNRRIGLKDSSHFNVAATLDRSQESIDMAMN
jgi:hypothetical protein